jgi:hypothetical protein
MHTIRLLRIKRRFHRPTGLDAPSRVYVSADLSYAGWARLNGATLGEFAAGIHRWEISQRLEPSNELEFEFQIDASPADAPSRCDVTLQIGDDSETKSIDFN